MRSAERGRLPRPRRGDDAVPTAGAKRKDNLRFPFLFGLLPFPCFLIRRRLPTCDRFEIRGTAEDFFSAADELPSEFVLLSNLFAVLDTVLLHRSATSSRRGIAVPRNSLACCNARHLRIRRLVQFIFVGAVYHNALTNCAALLSPRGPSLALRAIHLVPRLRRVARMCSSTLSDTANRLRKIRKKKSSAVPLFEAVAGLWSAPDYLTRER